MVRKFVSISATCLFLLVGCGGGSSDEPSSDTNTGSENTDSGEGTNSANNTVLTGVFVDSAVEGVSYSTATQSDVTNSAGEFSYLAGEQVTFSIGATELPTVDAAPQVSPVEMGEGSSNPDATTTNIARLLQSLDADGNPDNGITISAEAAANLAVINFDVSVDEFANNTDVINLVANSGSVNTTLVSAEEANAHLDETLNGPPTSSSISGLWARGEAGAPGFDGYLDIGTNSLVQYNVGERDSNSIAICYEASTIAISSLGNDLYDIEGQDENVRFIRVGNNLEVTPDGSETRAYPLVTDLDPTTLPMCMNGGGNQDSVALSAFAGFYDSTMNSDFQHYLLINTDGSAIEYEDREVNVEPCFHTEIWTFVSLGGSLFRLEREGRDPIEFSLSTQNGGLLLSSENIDSVSFPQVTTLTPADLSICSS